MWGIAHLFQEGHGVKGGIGIARALVTKYYNFYLYFGWIGIDLRRYYGRVSGVYIVTFYFLAVNHIQNGLSTLLVRY